MTEFVITASVVSLVTLLAGVVWMLWYEQKQTADWTEYGRRIDGFNEDEGGAP